MRGRRKIQGSALQHSRQACEDRYALKSTNFASSGEIGHLVPMTPIRLAKSTNSRSLLDTWISL